VAEPSAPVIVAESGTSKVFDAFLPSIAIVFAVASTALMVPDVCEAEDLAGEAAGAGEASSALAVWLAKGSAMAAAQRVVIRRLIFAVLIFIIGWLFGRAHVYKYLFTWALPDG